MNISKVTFAGLFILVLTMTFSNIPFATQYAAAEKIPNQYIVVFKDNVDSQSAASDIAIKHGLGLQFVYDHALKGFSANIPDAVLEKIKNDPRVSFVEQDFVVQAFDLPPQANAHGNSKRDGGSSGTPTQPSQVIPTGVDRIDADQSPTANINGVVQNVPVNVAIVDTGIDLNHPDLNSANAVTCIRGTSNANDDNGHGTHVAGIVGAIDNGIGVVGVAPGAKLYAVKVLDRSGSGSISSVICGINWVTQHTSSLHITVINMSLGCQCDSQAMHNAIISAVNAGVTFAVAAGNSAIDVSGFQPASYPEVMAVSAIVDTDGKCGGLGSGTSYGADDTLASFSDYGSGVSFAAPGVNILSTYKGQTYATLSGTSMASPHVAGAAALYIAAHPGSTPAQVKSGLQSTALDSSTACSGNGHGGYATIGSEIGGPLIYSALP